MTKENVNILYETTAAGHGAALMVFEVNIRRRNVGPLVANARLVEVNERDYYPEYAEVALLDAGLTVDDLVVAIRQAEATALGRVVRV